MLNYFKNFIYISERLNENDKNLNLTYKSNI